jgi:ABC-type antimicrobial peptide transport system permease subunit
LASTPGIEAVTLASDAPLTGYATDHVIADGDAPPADGRGATTPYTVVDEDYFAALGVDVLSGRTFDSRDRAGASEVVVINSALARRHWPGRDPVGQRLRVGNGRRPVEVIGVVPDGKYGDVDEATLPFMYFNLAQHYQPEITIIVRTRATRDVVARALQAIDPRIAIGGIGLMSLDDMLRLSLMLPRAIVWTTVVFGVLAFALAAFGLYSTVFYSVSQRRREMGIRTALGASRAHLFGLVFRESGWVAFIGGATGLAAGALLLPLAASIFYGVSPLEPAVLASVTATSLAITLGTTYVVVRPWTRLSAIDVLRG